MPAVVDRPVAVDKPVAVVDRPVAADKLVALDRQAGLPLVEQTALRMTGKLEFHAQRELHISGNIEDLQTWITFACIEGYLDKQFLIRS